MQVSLETQAWDKKTVAADIAADDNAADAATVCATAAITRPVCLPWQVCLSSQYTAILANNQATSADQNSASATKPMQHHS